MEELADAIYEIIKDYRNHDGVFITQKEILKWSDQFGNDNMFVLEELLHLLPEVYISRVIAKNLLRKRITKCIADSEYKGIVPYLTETEFLDMQLAHKSQPAILEIIDEILVEDYGESYKSYISYPKTNYIYFDDILASGSTVGRHVVQWLNQVDEQGKSFNQKLEDNEIRISVSLFALHSWGYSFQKYRILKEFNDKTVKKIQWFWDYEIQNHAKYANQRLNIAKPATGNNAVINSYYASLIAEKYPDYAFRDINTPIKETFFSNAQNRDRFEKILIEKGINIIDMIQGDPKPNIRPLGLINPAYKILGLGTHFFTWRNIPNNSPLVYWWEVPGHEWFALFPVANRG
ncbi:hypothetical protein AAEO56_14675 [Flavobacterium sp. DGU11]|uniref:PRTase-CE domain-containing protein n=1 Tax=Flavobacterium arundinis TaxID=3139143 RepID=A0ABU9HZY2_9FLAO